MNIFRTLHRSILVLFAIVVVSIVTLIHFSMTKIVAEQSRSHQASLSPAVKLVVDQVIEPLHIAETLSKSKELNEIMQLSSANDGRFDESQIFATLSRLEQEFQMGFFVALEKQRMQYNSDGTTMRLLEDEVNWYFKYRDTPEKSVGDIGKWEDTHFYIDIKIYDRNGDFIGFFGVAKSLAEFIKVFETHKATFGHDFIFVDPTGTIMLSSDPALNASKSNFNNLKDLAWYQSATKEVGFDADEALSAQAPVAEINNQLVNINEQDILIAQVNLDLFNWTMLLMSPLNEQQTEISSAFMFSAITVLVVIFLLFLIIYNLLYYFRKDMQHEGIVLPYCKMQSDEKIKYIVDTGAYRNDAFLVLVQLNDFYKRPVSEKNLPLLASLGTKISEYLLESVGKFTTDGEFGKVNESQWLILVQGTNSDDATQFMENIRHGLATIQTDCRKHQALLKFSMCKVKLGEQDSFVSAIMRLKPALDNLTTSDIERKVVDF
ncbi:MAG: hypothetical protein ACI9O6_002125 [Glaciecola sp.]|jgi:hypothetical protein